MRAKSPAPSAFPLDFLQQMLYHNRMAEVERTYADEFGEYKQKISMPDAGNEIPWIVDQLMELATFDATDFVEIVGGKARIKDTSELNPAQRRMIKSIKEDQFGCITITFHDRLAVIDRLAKQFGALMAKEEPAQKVIINLNYGDGLNRPPVDTNLI